MADLKDIAAKVLKIDRERVVHVTVLHRPPDVDPPRGVVTTDGWMLAALLDSGDRDIIGASARWAQAHGFTEALLAATHG